MELINFAVVEMICFVIAVSVGYAGYAAYQLDKTNKEMNRRRLRMEYVLRKAQKELYVLSGGRN